MNALPKFWKTFHPADHCKNYSTVLAVIDVVEDILEHLERQEIGLDIY